MKGIVSILAVLAFSGAALLLPPSVYALPAADSDVPTFINAEVVRVDPSAGTITLRGNGANTVLIVEGEALAGLAKLQPGDQVMLGYRLDGVTRIVTNVREVTPAAPVRAASPSVAIESVHVVAVNRGKRTVTVTDVTGARHVLVVEKTAAGMLPRLRVGDAVVLSYRTGKGGTRVVSRIEPVGVGSLTPVTAVTATAVIGGAAPPAVVVAPPPVIVTSPGVPAAGSTVAGGIPIPPNYPGAPAVLQPVPNVGPPTSTVGTVLPPAAVGAAAVQGERDLQTAAAALAQKANEIDALWFGYKDLCVKGNTPAGAATTTGREWFVLLDGTVQQPTDDACRQRLAQLTRTASLFQEQVDVARDAARKAEVLPGTMREILQRNRLDR